MFRRLAARSSRWPLAVVVAAVIAGPAAAACREDLVAAAKGLEASRAGVAAAKGGTSSQCAADRRHLAALQQVREAFGRCDRSADKAKNLDKVDGSIAVTTRNVEHSCKR